MNRDELKKLIRGIIVATPTPFNDNLEVDYGKMADMTKWWICLLYTSPSPRDRG